jgi:hypothetical protein
MRHRPSAEEALRKQTSCCGDAGLDVHAVACHAALHSPALELALLTSRASCHPWPEHRWRPGSRSRGRDCGRSAMPSASGRSGSLIRHRLLSGAERKAREAEGARTTAEGLLDAMDRAAGQRASWRGSGTRCGAARRAEV